MGLVGWTAGPSMGYRLRTLVVASSTVGAVSFALGYVARFLGY